MQMKYLKIDEKKKWNRMVTEQKSRSSFENVVRRCYHTCYLMLMSLDNLKK